jgi:hypothetical protein
MAICRKMPGGDVIRLRERQTGIPYRARIYQRWHADPLILTLHGGFADPTHWAYSAAPRVRTLRAAIPLLPGMMRLRAAGNT